MNSYIHSNILKTSKHFIEKFIVLQIPPLIRTKKYDFIFFRQLEYNYTLLLDFCCSKSLLNTTPQHTETIYTQSGLMCFADQEWKIKLTGRDTSPKSLLKIQKKLEKLLQTSLHPKTDSYQILSFQLKGGLTETHVWSVYYKDAEGKIIFYFFDCVLSLSTSFEEKNTIYYQKNLQACTTILKNLIELKETEKYNDIYSFSKEINIKYENITNLFKKCYNNTLFDQYKTQRLLYALSLLLYTPERLKEIKNKCQYNSYQVFQRDFKKDYTSPQAVRKKVITYIKSLYFKYM